MLIITTISAVILGFLYVKLSLAVIKLRRRYGVSVGHNDNEGLLRAIRAQANLAEYAPIALILMACLEINNAPLWLTAILATLFIVGRILHPIGMKDPSRSFKPRVKGIQLTLIAIIALGITNIFFLGWRIFFV